MTFSGKPNSSLLAYERAENDIVCDPISCVPCALGGADGGGEGATRGGGAEGGPGLIGAKDFLLFEGPGGGRAIPSIVVMRAPAFA